MDPLESASCGSILVADDDPVSRRLVTALLQAWGHDVEAVEDGEAAWAAAKRRNAPMLAVLDWTMPGLDGPEVCRRVRATPHLRGSYLVLLTARTGAWNVVEGLQSGADEFLVKPFDRLELRARIGSGSRVLGLQADLARRVGELEDALRTVDRLEGLLPICCCCKRIRQGDHYWRQVEDFVAERSRARFSHGLCPECLVREAEGLRQEAPVP